MLASSAEPIRTSAARQQPRLSAPAGFLVLAARGLDELGQLTLGKAELWGAHRWIIAEGLTWSSRVRGRRESDLGYGKAQAHH